MKFSQWIVYTKELIDLVKEVPKEVILGTKVYNSKHFSFQIDAFNNSCTFKLLKTIYEPQPIPYTQLSNNSNGWSINHTGNITVQGNFSIAPSTASPGTHIHTMANPQATDKLAQVSITILLDEMRLLDLKFIEKENGVSFVTYGVGTDARSEDGGKLFYSTLYLSKEKIMVNGKIYDVVNSPEAFNEDLLNDDVSILALYDMQSYFDVDSTE